MVDGKPDSERLGILLVDDEEIVHQTIGPYLRDLGHRVESAYDGVSALEMLTDGDYDLALVDLRMPKLDGLALLDKASKLRADVAIVIIEVISSRRGQPEGSRHHCRHLGPGQLSIGAKTIVEGWIASDRDSFGGDGLDAAFVDVVVIVGECASGQQGTEQRDGHQDRCSRSHVKRCQRNPR